MRGKQRTTITDARAIPPLVQVLKEGAEETQGNVAATTW
jgi:hypothetical protein